jgi:probable F420-dependent oxidoreductase
MKIDAPLLATDLALAGEEARQLEALGYDGTFTFEGPHDPFFPLLLAAAHTSRLALASAIAVALPRSPMQLANVGHDLQVFSKGRFVLGLGSQVKAHVERRFSATWTRPVARMREMALAIRAIWRCWNERAPLCFEGEFYRHTLMTPFFDPGPSPYGPPPIFLAGVGRPMTVIVGEVADGLFIHPMHSEAFLRATTLPALAEGLRLGGRTRADLALACQVLVVTGYTEEEYRQAETATRMQLAFYASTPAYRVVLETHGWGALQDELRALSRQGRWMEMGGLIDDAMLEAFTVRAEPRDVPERLRARYQGLVDRLSLICHAHPQRSRPTEWAEVVARCRAVA